MKQCIPYRVWPGKPAHRPAKCMALDEHVQVGRLLQSALQKCYMRRRPAKHIGLARCTLDDWVQCEYPSYEDMPQEVFSGLYYGAGIAYFGSTQPISAKDASAARMHLVTAKEILQKAYGETSKLVTAYLDKAIAELERFSGMAA